MQGASEGSAGSSHVNPVIYVAAVACLIWFTAVAVVCTLGVSQLWRFYSKPPVLKDWGDEAPDITVIRPISGLEPGLYECLASTFRQHYPKDKIHIRFCIADRKELSLPILERLVRDFPDFDAEILVESEDAVLVEKSDALGPNPKIRNMSRAYREAIGNFIWVLDCNIWIANGVCGRMLARLEGHGSSRKNKFVHQLPLVIDMEGTSLADELGQVSNSNNSIRTSSTASHDTTANADSILTKGGGRLEESFMSSSHAKFYTAINTVLLAPCIVGKSTMFRRSHLDALTDGRGIDYFSEFICEDHLIGDLLWKNDIPEEEQGEVWGKHALCFGDLAVQPMANMSVKEYWSRRVRWLRVRKWTVLLATLVEPGTESFLCATYGAFAVTTLPMFTAIPSTWTAFALFWLLTVSIWCLADRQLYIKLQSSASISVDENTPAFARPPPRAARRPFGEWFLSWLGRETLALPIWLWAFYGGTRVQWRGKQFWVGTDMKAHAIHDDSSNGHISKARRD